MRHCFTFTTMFIFATIAIMHSSAENGAKRNARISEANGSKASTTSAEDDSSFDVFLRFMQKYHRKYASESEQHRRYEIFRENLCRAAELNKFKTGTAVYGVTKFSDLTKQEFNKNYRMPKLWKNFETKFGKSFGKKFSKIDQLPPLPQQFDWRHYNVVTPVKNQGSKCVAGWAFSTVGNVEGVWAKKKESLLLLSVQQLLDCDHHDNGCYGGLPSHAYSSIVNFGGLELERFYPYIGMDESCHVQRERMVTYINGSLSITNDEDQIARILINRGPLSVGINSYAMDSYHSGIAMFWPVDCPPDIDHWMLLVGFGVENGVQFWVLKNSWGTDWGEQGYYRIQRGYGTCGVNTAVTTAVVY